jgi:hypothetical protein
MSHAAVATAERHRPAGGRSRAALRRVRDDADRPQTFGQRCHQRPPVFRRPPALRPTLRTPKIGGAIPSSAISVPAPVGSHVVPAAAGHRQQPMRSIRLLCRQGWTVTGVSRPTACGVAGRRKRPGDVRNVVDRIHRRRTTNLVSGRNLVRDSSPSRSRACPTCLDVNPELFPRGHRHANEKSRSRRAGEAAYFSFQRGAHVPQLGGRTRVMPKLCFAQDESCAGMQHGRLPRTRQRDIVPMFIWSERRDGRQLNIVLSSSRNPAGTPTVGAP